MFGDDASSRLVIRICCGPRCGAEPGHKAIYASIENTASADFDLRPVMCQGLCGSGVTVVLPDRNKIKIRDAEEARTSFKGHE